MSTHDALGQVLRVLRRNRAGRAMGIYSVCCAHPLALEATMRQARNDGTPLLLEATANQVNQFGGYTGIQPADFPGYVAAIAERAGLSADRIVLGGDHVGPVCWTHETAEQAMAKARTLVRAYMEAGFVKLHLDTSMPCADDALPLGEEVVAMRAAELCEAAEEAAGKRSGVARPVYVVGSEVPSPGGARQTVDHLEVTSARNALRTAAIHKMAFTARGVAAAWPRVIGLVVQPGVEFGHDSVHLYQPRRAERLSAALEELPGMVFEAHSTDYQPESAHRALVRDHFAILKVGPQLTYALREALFALSAVEEELLGREGFSGLPAVCDAAMRENPEQWIRHYPSRGPEAAWYRQHSYSDRIRYYWNHPAVSRTVDQLFDNLVEAGIPLSALQRHLPRQYNAVRAGRLRPAPRDLVIHNIMEVTSAYSRACGNDI